MMRGPAPRSGAIVALCTSCIVASGMSAADVHAHSPSIRQFAEWKAELRRDLISGTRAI